MPQRFSAVLLGWPQSGKTAFLSLLGRDCGEAVAPPEARVAIEENLAVLQAGRGLEHTEQRSVNDWRLGLTDEDGPEIDFRAADYSGELTAELCLAFARGNRELSAAKGLQRAIHRSHGVLFMIDCHALARSGGWDPWAESHALPLLRFIKEVISDERRHPIMFVLTRSDLVDEAFLNKGISDVTETIDDLGLNAEAVPFRAFTSKAGSPAPASGPLAEEFLAPAGELEPQPAPAEIVRRLWWRHSGTVVRPLTRVALGVLAGVLIVALAVGFITRERPVTAEELTAVVEQMPSDIVSESDAERIAGRLYLPPREANPRPPLSRLFTHWIDRIQAEDDALAAARQAYVARAAQEAEVLARRVSYRAEEGVWRPTEEERAYSAYEQDLRRLGAQDGFAQVARVRESKLDETLPAVGGLDQEQLESLAYEYQRIAEPIPDVVTEKLSETVYNRCTHEVAARLKEYAGAANPSDLQKLYEGEIPRLIDEALSVGEDRLTDQKREELKKARDYLNRLKRTEFLEFRLDALAQHGDEDFKPAVRIAVTPPVASPQRVARYYYPINGTDTTQPQEHGDWPTAAEASDTEYVFDQPVLKISWKYGDVVSIDVWDHHRQDEHLVTWRSDRIEWNDELAGGGYDLLGLSFMVFWAAHAQYTYGIDHAKYGYRLALKKEGNGYEMLQIPAFLREANKRRHLP